MNKIDKSSSSIRLVAPPRIACQECNLNSLCLPLSLSTDETGALDNIVERTRPLGKNQRIYATGEQFRSIYAVRTGAVMVYSITDDGDEHVVGFYYPGEIFGLNAIGSGNHINSAKALETSALCELPFTNLESLAKDMPSLQGRIYRLLSDEIAGDQQLQMLLSKKNVEERLGTFILNLSDRYRQRKLSPSSFSLPMSRRDIGNYLGIAVETISRIFSKLQRENILVVDKKEVRILDQHRLCGIAHEEHYPAESVTRGGGR
jgi:CRP/FNR family transcriptional regulator